MLGQRTARRARLRALSAALLGGSSLLAIGAPASAQTRTDDPAQVEEVLVTARRVEENLQEVPVAVTALSGDQMAAKGIETPKDLMFHAPSLTLSTLYGGLGGGFSLRGLAGGVTSYFAEVQGGPTGPSAPYFDLQSVQVLNGPQGTLFGRANTAGAVLVTPRRPDLDSLGGHVEVTVGDYGLNEISGVLNVPVIENELAVRVAVHRQRRDGFTSVIGSTLRFSEDNSDSIRASIEWAPGEGKFSNYTVLNYYKVDQTPNVGVLSGYNADYGLFNLPASYGAPGGAATGTAVFGANCSAAVGYGLSPDVQTCIDQRLRYLAQIKPALAAELARVKANDNGVRTVGATPNLRFNEELEQHILVNRSQLDLGQVGPTTVTAKNIFGYQRVRGMSAFMQDGLAGLISENYYAPFALTSSNIVNGQAVGRVGPWTETLSNEFQLTGSVSDDLLLWTVGAYYEHAPAGGPAGLEGDNREGTANFYRIFGGVLTPNLGWQPASPFFFGGHREQRAVFGQGTLDLSRFAPMFEALNFTGGFRRSWDESETISRAAVPVYPSGALTPGAESTTRTKSSGDNTSLSLDAQVTSDLLVYGARRTGYRPGGVNTVLGGEGLPGWQPVFAPETVKDLELGAKYDFSVGDVRGRLNAAVYKSRYGNIQRSMVAFVGNVQTIYSANVAAAEIKGLEVQGGLETGRWGLDGAYSYTDASYTRWISSDPLNILRPGNPACLPQSSAQACLVDLSGEPFPNTPKHQLSATVRFDVPLDPAMGEVRIALSGSHRSKAYFNTSSVLRALQLFPNDASTLAQPGFTRWDLRVDWRNVLGSKVDAAAFVHNLTDEVYATTGYFNYTSLGTALNYYAPPRTVGVTLRYEFGR